MILEIGPVGVWDISLCICWVFSQFRAEVVLARSFWNVLFEIIAAKYSNSTFWRVFKVPYCISSDVPIPTCPDKTVKICIVTKNHYTWLWFLKRKVSVFRVSGYLYQSKIMLFYWFNLLPICWHAWEWAQKSHDVNFTIYGQVVFVKNKCIASSETCVTASVHKNKVWQLILKPIFGLGAGPAPFGLWPPEK